MTTLTGPEFLDCLRSDGVDIGDPDYVRKCYTAQIHHVRQEGRSPLSCKEFADSLESNAGIHPRDRVDVGLHYLRELDYARRRAGEEE